MKALPDFAEVELLYVEGCPNRPALESHLRELVRGRSGVELRLRRVASAEEALQMRFLGSPSVRVDGHDVEPGAAVRDDYGLKCRLCRTGGELAGTPPDAWILAALGGGQH
jgi:hypothetical protein